MLKSSILSKSVRSVLSLRPSVPKMSRPSHSQRKTYSSAIQSSIAIPLKHESVTHIKGPRYNMLGSLVVQEHMLKVPLDYAKPEGEQIQLFVRELNPHNVNLPYLIYLQGGPGFEAPRPLEGSGWIGQALMNYRVLLMDQRGTGCSAALTAHSITGRSSNPEVQAEYCALFRADNIVRDAEIIRHVLGHGKPVAILGQSFGGFCCTTYLSMHPEGLSEVLMTGGIPPMVAASMSGDEVYARLVSRVISQNRKLYQRFPHLVERVRIVVNNIMSKGGSITTPAGNKLTPRSLQLLGLSGLGMSGGFERLHYLFESAFFDGPGEVSYAFLKGFDNWLSFDSNPVFAIMHEAIYCQGAASNWSAQRLRDTPPYKDLLDAEKALAEGREILFTGEMIFPFMFDEIANLRPLKGVAECLARKSDWPRIYDADVLRHNEVPIAAASYIEDMYVEHTLSEATAKDVKGMRVWFTSEYMHSGLRDDGQRIFDRLLNMVRGHIPLY